MSFKKKNHSRYKVITNYYVLVVTKCEINFYKIEYNNLKIKTAKKKGVSDIFSTF